MRRGGRALDQARLSVRELLRARVAGVALLGALALSLDKSGAVSGGGGGGGIPLSTSLAGDGLVLCAAAFYSAATFRLSVLAPVHASGPSGSPSSPQALAAAKSAAFAVGAVALALASGGLFSGAAEGGLAAFSPSSAAASGGDGGCCGSSQRTHQCSSTDDDDDKDGGGDDDDNSSRRRQCSCDHPCRMPRSPRQNLVRKCHSVSNRLRMTGWKAVPVCAVNEVKVPHE